MIINSLLDCDAYKFSMERVFFSKFPDVWATYEFKCRNPDVKFSVGMVMAIQAEVNHLCTLRFTKEELKWLSEIYYFADAKGFIEFLRMFQLNSDYIEVRYDEIDTPCNLRITATGPIWQVSMFEIYVLAIVNEIYFRFSYKDADYRDLERQGRVKLNEKISFLKYRPAVNFSDFGTRRRFSFYWQDEIIHQLRNNLPGTFTGTSNMFFAKKYGLKQIGTMGHEYIMLGQALDNVTLAKSQSYMLQLWQEVYRADLGIALSDTLGFDFFLHDFDKYFAYLFTGLRHDSGDPIAWGEKALRHYEKLGIDPKTKQLVFSDSLTVEKAYEIQKHFEGQTNVSFGIGTHFTCDMGVLALNIVFKLTSANGKPVAKISDSPGKGMCNDESYVNYLKTVIANSLQTNSQ